jgi:hypothetical protein
MNKNIIFIILLISSGILLGQNQVNVGLGAGQQFGFPFGIRAGYKWNKFEGSINGGILGYGITSNNIPKNYSKFEAMNYCIGVGLSFFLKERTLTPEISTGTSLSYNFGTVIFKTTDQLNILTSFLNVHTLCLNNEWQFKHVRWRFGYGVGYSNEYESITGKFYPLITLGCVFKIWQKKADY